MYSLQIKKSRRFYKKCCITLYLVSCYFNRQKIDKNFLPLKEKMSTVKLVAKNKSTKKDGTTPIYLQYCYDSNNRTLINTGNYIDPRHWNFEKDVVRRSYDDHESLNDDLEEELKKVKKIIKDALKAGIDPTIDFVKNRYNNPVSNDVKLSFFGALDKFIEDSKGRVVNDVIKDYNSLKKHLNGFAEYSNQSITFSSINYAFYQQFVSYLIFEAVKPDETKGLATNTVGKQIKNLKVFIKDCMRKGICKPIDLSDFKTVTEEVDKIYLNADEIDTIANLDYSDNKEMDIVRDYLLIGCLTGLRFSDFSTIEKHHINGKYLNKRINKTHQSQTIPLKKKVKEIFKKYNNNLPKIDSNKFNKLVKKVGEKAKINDEVELVYKKGAEKIRTVHKKYELISSHTCRRSFCTNEFLAGTPIIYIMKISGHKTEKSFMRYLKIDQDVAAEKMLEIWNES